MTHTTDETLPNYVSTFTHSWIGNRVHSWIEIRVNRCQTCPPSVVINKNINSSIFKGKESALAIFTWISHDFYIFFGNTNSSECLIYIETFNSITNPFNFFKKKKVHNPLRILSTEKGGMHFQWNFKDSICCSWFLISSRNGRETTSILLMFCFIAERRVFSLHKP